MTVAQNEQNLSPLELSTISYIGTLKNSEVVLMNEILKKNNSSISPAIIDELKSQVPKKVLDQMDSITKEIAEYDQNHLAEFIQKLKETFHISDAGFGSKESNKESEITAFKVEISKFPDVSKKIAAIRVIKEILNLGLKESKELVEEIILGGSKVLYDSVDKKQSEETKEKLKEFFEVTVSAA